jgi:predicted small secreted protein
MNANIIAGLFSGLLVTLLVVVFRAIWRDSLVPWFENRVYKDIRVEGTWFSLYPTVIGNRQETINLDRHGHEISGSFVCTTKHNDGEQYEVRGSFRNMILTLIYESRDSQKVDRGTITLKCIKNGERLSGKIAIYHDSTDTIDVNEIIWFRSKKDLVPFLKNIQEKDDTMRNLREREKEASVEMKKLANTPSDEG